jgi:hypothetical protein
MGFVIVTIDERAGIKIKSLGSRGPEIESHHWRVDTKDFSFELSTYVCDKSEAVRGIRKVLLSPTVKLLEYLMRGPGEAADRKAMIDNVQQGLKLLFRCSYFRDAFFFERGSAVKFDNSTGRFVTVDAPGLWDVGQSDTGPL